MKRDKLLFLEGIRGVAAIIVFLCHLRNTFIIDLDKKIYLFLVGHTNSIFISKTIYGLLNILLDGNLAVFIFWFMSAYVISIRLFQEKDKDYLVSAFSKRYIRLLIPSAVSVFFAYCLMKLDFMYNIQLSKQFGHLYDDGWLGSQYGFTPSFLGAIRSGLFDTFFSFNATINYNSSLWSMNPELFGSLFCFGLFAVYGTNTRRYYIYLLIILIAYKLHINFLQTFLIGFFICDIDYSSNDLKKYLDPLESVLSKWYISYLLFFVLLIIAGINGFWIFSNTTISALLVFVIMKSKALKHLFEMKPIVWLGKISFSLYLIHIPLICSLSCYLYLILPFSHEFKILTSALLTLFIALVIAAIYTRFIDKMSVRLSNKVGKALIS
jgi:peptidoglycan/LPS O-acetylase OafA/YrhL